MAFTQDLFSSYRGYSDGNTRIGETNRIWYDSNTNSMRIGDGSTPGGVIIAGGGGLVLQALSVSTNTAANGGSLTYNNGVFSYSPADLSSFATTSYVNSIKDRITSPNGLYSDIIDNTGTTTIAGNLIPNVITNSLGSIEKPWQHVYVSTGSIVIADTNPLVDGVTISNTSQYIVFSKGGIKVQSPDETHEIFQLDNTGRLILKSTLPGNTTHAALDLIGNVTGMTLETGNTGVMLHATGIQDQPSRIYLDGIGVQTNLQNAYPAFVGHSARGTVELPTQTLSGDIIARFGGNAYATTLGFQSITNTRIDMVATDDQTSTTRGSEIQLWTTPIGTAVPEQSVAIDYAGLSLIHATNPAAGITFKDLSRLTYFPPQTNMNGKFLKVTRDGSGNDVMSWENVPVISGTVLFKGVWDASVNPPTITDASGSVGWEWIVSVGGTQNLGNGVITFAEGDLVIHDGTHYIKIPGPKSQVNSDWTAISGVSVILNKPNLKSIATSGSWNDLLDKPYIPPAQIRSDWNAVTGVSVIENKPTLATVATSGNYNDLTNKPILVKSTYLVNTATYAATTLDYYIGVNYTGVVTITLPAATDGREIIIKDESGLCSINNIQIIGTIDNTTNATLAINNGALHFIYRAGWRII